MIAYIQTHPLRAASRHPLGCSKGTVCAVGFTLVELLVVITVIGVLVGLLLPAIQAAREAARRSQCTNNLKQQGLGMQNYYAQQRRFPAGARVHPNNNVAAISWRVSILPFIELNTLYDEISPLSNGGASNWSANRTIIDVYVCPSAEEQSNASALSKLSNYFGITGAGRNQELIDLEDNICGDVFADGILYSDSKTTIAMIGDGTSNTLLIGERTYELNPWMMGSIQSKLAMRICLGSVNNIYYPINTNSLVHPDGFYVDDDDAPTGYPKLMLLNDLFFGSEHPGGAQFGFADGSVHMLSEDIDFTVYQDLATKDGGETVGGRY